MVQCPETVIKDRVNVPGGINFDAKLRRESTSLVDLFYGHISGMDALARGLRNAAKMFEVPCVLQAIFPVSHAAYVSVCLLMEGQRLHDWGALQGGLIKG